MELKLTDIKKVRKLQIFRTVICELFLKFESLVFFKPDVKFYAHLSKPKVQKYHANIFGGKREQVLEKRTFLAKRLLRNKLINLRVRGVCLDGRTKWINKNYFNLLTFELIYLHL